MCSGNVGRDGERKQRTLLTIDQTHTFARFLQAFPRYRKKLWVRHLYEESEVSNQKAFQSFAGNVSHFEAETENICPHYVQFMNDVDLPWNTMRIYQCGVLVWPLTCALMIADWKLVFAILQGAAAF